MKLKPLFLWLALVALLPTATIVPAAETARPLVVGMELAYPPFEMTDLKGKPSGVSVDLAIDLANLSVVFMQSTWIFKIRACMS